MKVFIDTNVWLSGRFRPGLCAELLEALVEMDVEILLDQQVVDEFRRIARDKLGVDEPLLTQSERFFRCYARVVPAAERAAEGVPDPDDAWIIGAALAAGADGFVTGDQPLQNLRRLANMPILDPRTAYQWLRGLD